VIGRHQEPRCVERRNHAAVVEALSKDRETVGDAGAHVRRRRVGNKSAAAVPLNLGANFGVIGMHDDPPTADTGVFQPR
jgi:hypothetical protein